MNFTKDLLQSLSTVADTKTLEREICKSSFEMFVKRFWSEVPGTGKLVWNWHLGLFCSELDIIARRVFKGVPKEYDLLVNVSPGTSKSTVFSILFPAWCWTIAPHLRFLTASHTDELVLDLANKTRQVIKGEKYSALFPEVELNTSQDAKGYYTNTAGGDRKTCTVAGKSPMGFHCHMVINDDLTDPKKVLSEAETKAAREFITNVIPSRKVDKAVSVTITVMQRLGLNDPSDVILKEATKEGASVIRHICLPAELYKKEDGGWDVSNVKPSELARFYEDGLMDPKRMSRSVLAEYKARSALYYSTQFLQLPYAQDGSRFKPQWFSKRVKAAPYHATRIRYWDRACLVAGTMVETLFGPKPIENIHAGEFVLTRQGYKEVLWAGVTKKVRQDDLASLFFDNGGVLTGTKDHPVWTENRGWVDIVSMRGSDYSLCITKGGDTWLKDGDRSVNLTRSLPCSKELLTPGGRARGISRLTDGISSERSFGQTRCIGQFGGSITEKSQKDMMSITLMGIGTTTLLKTLIASLGQSITKFIMPLLSGTKRKHERSIRKNSSRQVGSTCGRNLLPSMSASNVEGSLNRSMLMGEGLSFAVPDVVRGTIEGRLQDNVPFAVRSFGTDLVRQLALKSVPSFIGGKSVFGVERCLKRRQGINNFAGEAAELNGSIPVYDLTVKDAHEFFANGILVHNSTDAGGCWTAGVLLAKGDNGDYFIEDVVHGQWEPTERNARMRATALRDRSRYGPNNEPAIYVEAEGGSSGRDAWKDIVKNLEGFSVWEDRPTGSKDTRSEPWAAQLAAGNVYVVDQGESQGTGRSGWDIEDFVNEHVRFKPDTGKRLGGQKDRVDAAAAAFNLLSGRKQKTSFRILPSLQRNKAKTRKIVACSVGELQSLLVEENALLIIFTNPPIPEEVMCGAVLLPGDRVESRDGELSSTRNGTGVNVVEPAQADPIHGLSRLVAPVFTIPFMDLDPQNYQETWDVPIPPWNLTPDKLIMTPQDGKKIWSKILKRYDPPWEIVVFADQGDRRAMSVATSVADALKFGKECIYSPTLGENKVTDPVVNPHIVAIIKNSRYMVVE